jgi:predicted methyltransferase
LAVRRSYFRKRLPRHPATSAVGVPIDARPESRPPRFGIAGELYSQDFYDHLARVLKKRGRLFHYTGSPNKLTTGRDVPNEVAKRLRKAGFATELSGDGVLANKTK